MAKNIHSEQTQYDDLIIAFLDGTITSEERVRLLAWVSESPQNKELFRQTQQAWLLAAASERQRFDRRSDRAYEQFRRRIEQDATASRSDSSRGARLIPLAARNWMSRAAVAAIALGIGIGATMWFDGRQTEQRLLASAYAIEAPRGAVVKVTLPDGSVAWLNADSRLSYDGAFGISNRDVKLDGEGYFEVAKKGKKIPFRVGADEVMVEVLGTKFNVSAYASDPDIEVTLTQGSVALTADGVRTLLHPGEIASYDRASGETSVRPMGDDAPYWQTGKINFDNSSLTRITRVLERAYNVRFVIHTDSLQEMKFHGEFDVDKNSIDDIMQVMAATQHLSYRIRGNTIDIY